MLHLDDAFAGRDGATIILLDDDATKATIYTRHEPVIARLARLPDARQYPCECETRVFTCGAARLAFHKPSPSQTRRQALRAAEQQARRQEREGS
jgi:hypothetical protein